MTSNPLLGLNVLLVEDEFLIAVDAEDMLKALQVATVRIASTYEEAERSVNEAEFDVAVLDVNLNGKMSFPLGEILSNRGIPFVFASGYNLDQRADSRSGGLWLSKPYKKDQLEERLVEALRAAA